MSLPEPFAYPIEPHERKHSPAGYAEYTQYKPWLRDDFFFRCVYCLQRETWSRAGMAAFSVDHIIPQSLDTNNRFLCDYSNLLYSCLRCNSFRQNDLVLGPTREGFGWHLRVQADGTIVGLTFDGLVLVRLLQLNTPAAVGERQRIFRILGRRARYPNDPEVLRDYHEAFGYPADIPDLRRRPPHGPNPPDGNTLVANTEHCYFALREAGRLPLVYTLGDVQREPPS